MGLVSQVLPDADAARQAAQQLAAQMAENSPVVLRGIKQTLRYGESHSVEDGLDQVAHYNAAFLPSDDLAEAFTAFMERRDPRFQGR